MTHMTHTKEHPPAVAVAVTNLETRLSSAKFDDDDEDDDEEKMLI